MSLFFLGGSIVFRRYRAQEHAAYPVLNANAFVPPPTHQLVFFGLWWPLGTRLAKGPTVLLFQRYAKYVVSFYADKGGRILTLFPQAASAKARQRTNPKEPTRTKNDINNIPIESEKKVQPRLQLHESQNHTRDAFSCDHTRSKDDKESCGPLGSQRRDRQSDDPTKEKRHRIKRRDHKRQPILRRAGTPVSGVLVKLFPR